MRQWDKPTQSFPQSQESSQSLRSGRVSPDGILPVTICSGVNSSLSVRLSEVYGMCLGGFSILLPLDDEVSDVYMGCSLFVCGATLEDVADCDVQVYGDEFAFPFFVAVNVGKCYGSASCDD